MEKNNFFKEGIIIGAGLGIIGNFLVNTILELIRITSKEFYFLILNILFFTSCIFLFVIYKKLIKKGGENEKKNKM